MPKKKSKSSLGISIIIPNLNGQNYLSQLIYSLDKAIKNTPSLSFEIILVDNNSSDDSIKIFQSELKHPHSSIIFNLKNTGFAAAVNQGINKAKFSWICLLNNDLRLHPDFFKNFLPHLSSKPKHHTLCGTILEQNGVFIESQGVSFYTSGKCTQNHHHQTYKDKPPHTVWGASGAATLYHKQTLKELGLFDKHFFAYIEDVDLSYRLHTLNYSTFCVPQSLSYHVGGATSDTLGNLRAFYSYRNWYLLILKNYSKKKILKHLPQILTQRLRDYSFFLSQTKTLFWLPHTLSIHIQILALLPYLITQNRRFHNLLKSKQL